MSWEGHEPVRLTRCSNGHLMPAGETECPQCNEQPKPEAEVERSKATARTTSSSAGGERGTIRCPNGHTVPSGSSFCNQCGESVEAPDDRGAATAADEPLEAEEQPDQQGNRKKLLIGLGAAGVLILVLLLLSNAGQTHEITGSFVVFDDDASSSDCRLGMDGGYSDIGPGTAVEVRNETGETIAAGRLGVGESIGLGCNFPIEVHDVPDAKFYRIGVGRRGELSYSKDEIEARDWEVAFQLGDL